MKLEDLLSICKSYSKLGWAVQEQLDSILDDMSSMKDQNPNALAMIKDFLNEIGSDCDDAEEYAEEINEFLNSDDHDEDEDE